MTSLRLLQHALRHGAHLVLPLLLALAGCATPPPGTGSPASEATAAALAPVVAAVAPPVSVAASAPAVGAPALALPTSPAEASEQGLAAAAPRDPLRPDTRIDLDDRSAQVDLWARIRQGFAMPDLQGDLVRSAEQWYASRPDYVQRMTERGSRYLFHVVEEVERRGMPSELALLPFIESAFNPQAVSTAKASGMWQFIPSTGKHFELKQNLWRDDRRDVLASTRAALDYLQKLHGMFGDWQLALAAYNWGEGNVQRAIARNQKKGLPTDYESLAMPNETRGYVPKLQAVKNIVLRPEAYALSLPPLTNHPYFLSVPITRDIDVATAMRLSGMSAEDFHNLNPQLNKPLILAAGTPQVLLPYDNANRFVRELAEYKGPLASWTAWVAPKTLRPADAAKQVGMSETALREVNRIPAKMLVKAGSTLLVPRDAKRQDDVPEHLADNARIDLAPDAPPLRRVAFKAGKRDSVATVAGRYKVSAQQVAQWNRVAPAASFRAGQTVVVFVPNQAIRVASSSVRTATTRRAVASVRATSTHGTTRKLAKAPQGGRRVASADRPRTVAGE